MLTQLGGGAELPEEVGLSPWLGAHPPILLTLLPLVKLDGNLTMRETVMIHCSPCDLREYLQAQPLWGCPGGGRVMYQDGITKGS